MESELREQEPNPNLAPTKIVPVVSGGLDSVTMLYHLDAQGYVFDRVLSFNYGQRHKKELSFAGIHAERFGAEHTIIDLSQSGLLDILKESNSSLTNPDQVVPEGHYAAESMKLTIVPNRNMMMAALALSAAVAEGAQAIAMAVHAGDHAIYPDCRPSFFNYLIDAARAGNEGTSLKHQGILTPFIYISKNDIAKRAIELDVHLETTWSCYKGEQVHCGRCGTCCERLEAIDYAERTLGREGYDRTPYADSEYWRSVLATP